MSGAWLQRVPPFRGYCETSRDRDWVPPSHVFEHSPQLLQPPILQSTGPWSGQQSSLHGCTRFSEPLHPSPLWNDGCLIVRDAVCCPPPQLREHSDQAPQSEYLQACGSMQFSNWSWSHSCVSFSGPSQGVPQSW